MAYILVIDEDAEFFRLLDEFLRHRGFTCAHASSMSRGLQKLADDVFDILLLDATTPGLDGPELGQFLRNDPRYKNLPVLMFTVRGSEFGRADGWDTGADYYLPKPFNPKELVPILRMLLRNSVFRF